MPKGRCGEFTSRCRESDPNRRSRFSIISVFHQSEMGFCREPRRDRAADGFCWSLLDLCLFYDLPHVRERKYFNHLITEFSGTRSLGLAWRTAEAYLVRGIWFDFHEVPGSVP